MSDGNLISAITALAGATFGGVMSLIGSWLVNQRQVRAQWLAQDSVGRQSLYMEFIEAASKCHIAALQHDQPDVSLLVDLYAKISRMHVISSPQVIAAAEHVLRRIIDAYFQPDIIFTKVKLRAMVEDGSFDLFRTFSESCQAEFNVAGAPLGLTGGVSVDAPARLTPRS